MTSPERHHIIASCEGGSDEPVNKILMPQLQHQALHTLFATRLPHEQIQKILRLSQNVTTGDFRKAVGEIILAFEMDQKLYIQEGFKISK